jgi:superfamily II DNA or RNA helicase
MNISRINKNWIKIDFTDDFSWEKVNEIKKVPGRKFKSDTKNWHVPLNTRSSVAQFLQFCNQFDVSLPEQIEEMIKELRERFQKEERREKKNRKLATASKPKKLDRVYGTAKGMRLREYQKAAVEYIEKNERVILGDEPGLGKTISSIGAVQHLDAYPVLCVVPAAVRSHWEKEWNTWLPRKAVKTVKSGNHTDFRGSIVICTYSLVYKFTEKFKEKNFQAIIADESHKLKNSSTKRASSVKKIAKDIPYRMLLTGTPVINEPSELINQLKILGVFKDVFGGWMNFTDRYCLPPDAPVLMSNLKEKEISKIEKGDKVIGWREQEGNKNRTMTEEKVIGNYTREAELIEATLDNGQTIKCTPDHSWLSGRGNYGTNNGSHKWTSVPSKTKFSSKLSFLFRTNSKTNTETEEYKKGYLIGAYRGDGWLSKKTVETEKIWRDKPNTSFNKYASGIATQDEKIIDRCEEYLQEFKMPYGRRERKDGLHEINNNSEEAFNFFTSDQNKNEDWYSGFLAGLYDTDGSGNFICQYKKHNSSTRKIAEEAFQALEFENYEKRNSGIRIGNGRDSLIRFYQKTDPSLRRKIKSYVLGSGGQFFSDDPEVVNIKKLGKQKVHSIETTSGNYVAYGLASKNCNRKEAKFGKWDISGASNLDELFERLTGNCYIRRNKSDEDILNELPEKQRTIIDLEIDNRKKYNDIEENLADHLREKYKQDEEFQKRIDHLSDPLQEAHKERHAEARVRRAMNAEHLVKINELRQATSKGKMKEAKKWIRNFAENGEPLLIFAHYKDTTQTLADEFDCPKITGDVDADRRGEIVEEFQNGEHQLLVLNVEAGGVGITLTEASNVAFVEIPWTWAEISQAEDRCHRISQTDSVNIHFLLANDTIDEEMFRLVREKKVITDQVNKGFEVEDIEQQSVMAGLAERIMERQES